MAKINKLKFCEKSKTKNLFPEPPKYSNKVLVGPWCHDRLNSIDYSDKQHKPNSSYRTDYTPKPCVLDKSQCWDMKLKSEDSNFIRQTGVEKYPNHFENFSSLYDLSYNHFPRWYKDDEPGTHTDYIPSYGNVTNYGLVNYKKEKWSYDKQKSQDNITTTYKINFQAPKIQDYTFTRFGIPLSNSSIMYPVNNITVALNLRDIPSSPVPTQDLVIVPKPQHFNPITWEWVPEFPITKCI